jgi:ParB family chromosome partitioning protein
MSAPTFFENAIFHIEVEKIKPNPYQPRREFDESALRELADSIRMYGVLQPLVVTRKEFEKEDGGIGVEYELIAGERRLRASKIAGLIQVPAVIRAMEDDSRMKLELAIIENLQREDLNPVDRAVAFKKLADEFGFKHGDIAKKVGKSRVYVSNTMRLLALPQEILDALSVGKISEGHTRPLLMLDDRPEEQVTLFKEITFKKMSVREAEGVARRIAYDRVRKKTLDPEMVEMEEKLTEALGTRVRIDRKDMGGKITIDFFSNDDIRFILSAVAKESDGTRNAHVPVARIAHDIVAVREEKKEVPPLMEAPKEGEYATPTEAPSVIEEIDAPVSSSREEKVPGVSVPAYGVEQSEDGDRDGEYHRADLVDDRTKEEADFSENTTPEDEYAPKEGEKKDNDEDLYSIHNFSV